MYSHLLKPSIWVFPVKKIREVIETFEELGIEKYILSGHLRLSALQIKAIYHYLEDNNMAIVIED